MKRRTFYHISLFIPYLLLAVSGIFTFLSGGFDSFATDTAAPDFLWGMLFFFTFSGIIWGPLYTWLVVVMLLWGRRRGTDEVRRMYLFSPLLLACSMGLPILVTDPASSGRFLLEGLLRMNNLGFAVPVLLGDTNEETIYFGMAWLFIAAICVVVGYLFVGIVLWIERIMLKRGLLRDEPENPAPTPS